MDIITVEELSLAMQRRIGEDKEEADHDALFILNLFGFEERLIDNILDPESRQLFYMLEGEGIVTPVREETTLYDSREWRIHYWALKTDYIRYLNNHTIEKEKEVDHDIYSELSEDIWVSTLNTSALLGSGE